VEWQPVYPPPKTKDPLIEQTILAFVGIILLNHRIAGPLYRFEETVKEYLQGKFSLRIRLRNKDEFQEFAHMLNRVAIYLEAAQLRQYCFQLKCQQKLTELNNQIGPDSTEETKRLLTELLNSYNHRQDDFLKSLLN
jgi:hypothetical protein